MKWLMTILGKRKKSKRGFTLIELLFVVIVIAILAAAGVALYMRSLDKARASEGLAILSSVRTHYLVEWAEDEEEPDPPVSLLGWGIETGKNRWWIEDVTTPADQDGNFNIETGSFPVVELVGLESGIDGTDILDGIKLSINCSTGEIVQTYP